MESTDLASLAKITDILNFGKILSMLIAIAVLWLVVNTMQRGSAKIGLKLPSRRLLILQIVTVLSFVIYIIGGFAIVYGILDPPKELLIALGGSAAVAIGLALKDLVSSLVAGLILLFDRPFQVGDRVTFDGNYGEITNIGLRAVQLTTLDDNLVTIPNSRFMNDVVASGNAGALDMMVCITFNLALEADINEARDIIYETTVTSRFVYLKKPVVVIACEKAVAERIAIELTVKAYVLDVKFEKAFQTDTVFRVQEIFRARDIMRPSRDPLAKIIDSRSNQC